MVQFHIHKFMLELFLNSFFFGTFCR